VGAARHRIKLDEVQEAGIQKKALVLGVGLTALNPYFILWWLTVGLGLVVQAVELGALLGVLIMYVSHVWMDYAWLTGTAYLSARVCPKMQVCLKRPWRYDQAAAMFFSV
jgi:threonine/homoserine/homoserine lactone efflux protein